MKIPFRNIYLPIIFSATLSLIIFIVFLLFFANIVEMPISEKLIGIIKVIPIIFFLFLIISILISIPIGFFAWKLASKTLFPNEFFVILSFVFGLIVGLTINHFFVFDDFYKSVAILLSFGLAGLWSSSLFVILNKKIN